MAVTAYSLSVVDAALILGPANPPTFAVLAWQWLTDSDISRQNMGLAASCLLLMMLGAFVIGGAFGVGNNTAARRAFFRQTLCTESDLRRRGDHLFTFSGRLYGLSQYSPCGPSLKAGSFRLDFLKT
ncbi:Inner membrane ABC transporter permease protein ynjC [Cedecea neteri]|uniref:Inner membrane ABC transporter permease protein ynjC n=1 Tax=Cedecea neteri TaxID=158822 RepID=A0A2X3IPI9_9ENTR|nr:Inner membrane ABC transporter permease protein ynjC [Cedecea neteri]